MSNLSNNVNKNNDKKLSFTLDVDSNDDFTMHKKKINDTYQAFHLRKSMIQ